MFKGFKIKLKVNELTREYLKRIFNIHKEIFNLTLKELDAYYIKNDKVLETSKIRELFINYLNENKVRLADIEIEPIKKTLNNLYFKYKEKIKGKKIRLKYLEEFDRFSLFINEFKIYESTLFIKGYKLKLTQQLNIDSKIFNTRLCFDGIDFYFSGSYSFTPDFNKNKRDFAIGVDLGIKNFYTLNNGFVYPNINDSDRMKFLERKANVIHSNMQHIKNFRGDLPESNNYRELLFKYKKIRREQTRIRENHLYKAVNIITKLNPKCVVIEDLNVKELIKDNPLARRIQEETFRKFRTILEYKCKRNDIKLITANRYFPSSKKCSRCGYVIDNLSLNERTYVCPHCGLIIDRDLNAAINLSNLAKIKVPSLREEVTNKLEMNA